MMSTQHCFNGDCISPLTHYCSIGSVQTIEQNLRRTMACIYQPPISPILQLFPDLRGLDPPRFGNGGHFNSSKHSRSVGKSNPPMNQSATGNYTSDYRHNNTLVIYCSTKLGRIYNIINVLSFGTSMTFLRILSDSSWPQSFQHLTHVCSTSHKKEMCDIQCTKTPLSKSKMSDITLAEVEVNDDN